MKNLPIDKIILQVPNFNSCTASENLGGFAVLCLPQAKLEDCPSSSWKQLTESTLPESEQMSLLFCAREVPNFESCTVEKKNPKFLCLPQSKPEDCQLLSWKQLTESTHLRGCAPTWYDLTSFMYEVMTGPGWLVLVGVLGLCGRVCMYLRGKKRRNFHA